jgi:alkylhydroperoxidase family enzyme
VQHHILLGERLGLSADKLNLVVVWREAPQFSARERAALAWTEALTLINDGHVPDAVYAQALAQFSEEELANLSLAVVAINGANRLNIAFRTVPGSHRARAGAFSGKVEAGFPSENATNVRKQAAE